MHGPPSAGIITFRVLLRLTQVSSDTWLTAYHFSGTVGKKLSEWQWWPPAKDLWAQRDRYLMKGSIVAIPGRGKDSGSKVMMSENIVKRRPQEFLEIIISSPV